MPLRAPPRGAAEGPWLCREPGQASPSQRLPASYLSVACGEERYRLTDFYVLALAHHPSGMIPEVRRGRPANHVLATDNVNRHASRPEGKRKPRGAIAPT